MIQTSSPERSSCDCDLIFWDRNDDDTRELAMQLWELVVYLEQEVDAAGFIGATLEQDHNTGLIEMKRKEII